MRFFISILIIFIFTGCTQAPQKSDTGASPGTLTAKQQKNHSEQNLNLSRKPELTRSMAMQRKSQIANVSYKLNLDLTNYLSANYSGISIIEFDLLKNEDVLLDMSGGQILTSEINGKVVKLVRDDSFIHLNHEFLKLGRNTLKIEFSHLFSKTGEGLYLFTDTEDKNVYIYSDFEPYSANKLAPFFDQPDLKAQLELTVRAPKLWEVVGNEKVESTSLDANYKTVHFFKTPPLSTYLFAVIAGPFAKWEDKYKNISLRLLARKSLARFVSFKEWFEVTKQGLDFFENYFQTPYPFSKFDQIIVPDFNAGAMENAGAVTFSEKFVHRGSYTRLDYISMSNVILHEMSHMWFGDLVTMQWWNDLWLNESFATYMATLAQTTATKYKEGWVAFHSQKLNAYQEDQLVTTHPVSSDIQNMSDVFSSFDSITYGKGASILKELNFYIGNDLFQKSLQDYFKKYKFQNTTFDQFVSVFESSSKMKLQDWFQAWLKTTGVDSLRANFTCSATNAVNVSLQLSAGHRPHALKIAGYKLVNGKVVQTHMSDIKVPLSAVDSTEAPLLALTPNAGCPDFIYANAEDQAYLVNVLDQKTLDFVLKNINLISTPAFKKIIWADLWQMVRDQKLKLDRFSDAALNALTIESDPMVIEFLASKTVGYKFGEYDSVYYYQPHETAIEQKLYASMTKKYEDVLYQRVRAEYKDLNFLFFDIYLSAVSSNAGVKNVIGLYSKMHDADRRWKAIITLCRENFVDVDELMKTELRSDRSDSAQKNALTCRASKPDKKSKSEFVSKLTTTVNPYNANETSRISRVIFSARQRPLVAQFADEIYNAFQNVWPKWDQAFQSNMAKGFAPAYCNEAANKKLGSLIRSSDIQASTLKVPLLEILDEDTRCIAIRKFNFN